MPRPVIETASGGSLEATGPSVNFFGLPRMRYLTAQLFLPDGCTTRCSPAQPGSGISRRVAFGMALATAIVVSPRATNCSSGFVTPKSPETAAASISCSATLRSPEGLRGNKIALSAYVILCPGHLQTDIDNPSNFKGFR